MFEEVLCPDLWSMVCSEFLRGRNSKPLRRVRYCRGGVDRGDVFTSCKFDLLPGPSLFIFGQTLQLVGLDPSINL